MRIPLVAAVVLTLSSAAQAQAQAQTPPRPEINVVELSTLVKAGGEISGRTIPAAALALVLIERPEPTDKGRTITIVDSDVTGFLEVTRKVIQRPCVFRNVTFDGRVDITGSNAQGALTFAGKTRFAKEVTFSEATYMGQVTFEEGVVFDDRFEAFRASFGEARFDHVVWKRRATFSDATFRGSASFTGSRLESGTSWSTYSQMFEHTVFQDTADFSQTTLGGTALFDRAIFAKEASFAGAKLESIHFADTIFTGKVVFSGAELTGAATFQRVTFLAEAHLDAIDEGRSEADRAGDLVLSEVRGVGRVYLGGSTFKSVGFGRTDPKGALARGPSTFDKPVHMELLRADAADFTAVEFRDLADLTGASFGRFVSFRRVTFGGDAMFGGASFPDATGGTDKEPRGVDLGGAKFEKKVVLRHDQLVEAEPWYRFWVAPRLKLLSPDAATWASLEQAFLASGDLRSGREAGRERALLASPGRKGTFADKASLVLWGHGSNPVRLAVWLVVFNAIFAAIYWTQTRPLGDGLPPIEGWMARLRFVTSFAARTAASPSLGWRGARTTGFKVVTAVHSIGAKVLFFFLLRAAANVSPLLDDLVGKLLPG